MDLKKCPVCYTKLEDRGEQYYCPVCDISFKKELRRGALVFGISRVAVQEDGLVSAKLGALYVVTPLRSNAPVSVRTFRYFKEMVKKLNASSVDYVCVEIEKGGALDTFKEAQVPREVEVGFAAEKKYRRRGYYVLESRARVRVCKETPVRRYQDFYTLLLYLS